MNMIEFCHKTYSLGNKKHIAQEMTITSIPKEK